MVRQIAKAVYQRDALMRQVMLIWAILFIQDLD